MQEAETELWDTALDSDQSQLLLQTQGTITATTRDSASAKRTSTPTELFPGGKRTTIDTMDASAMEELITRRPASAAEAIGKQCMGQLTGMWNNFEKSFIEQFAAHKNEVTATIEAKITPLQLQFTTMNNEIDALNMKVKTLSTSGSSAGGSAGSGGGTGGTNNGTTFDANWKPRYLEIKDFLEDWSTRKGALEETAVTEIIGNIWDNVAPEIVDLFDADATNRTQGRVLFTNVLLKFRTGVDIDAMHRARKAIKTYMDGEPINGRQPKVIVDNHQSRKTLFAAGAKAMNWLERHGAARIIFKCEWGPPLRIYKTQGVSSPTEVCCWDEKNGGWTCREKVLETMCAGKGGTDFINAVQ